MVQALVVLVALLFTALLGLVLASGRIPRLRALGIAPALREVMPVASVTAAVLCAGYWFIAVSELRLPRFLPCLAMSLLLALPATVARGRLRRIIAGSTIVLVTLLTLADALYFRFFGSIVPLLGASDTRQAWNVTASIAALFARRDLVFIPLFAAGGWLLASRGEPAGADNRRMMKAAFRWALAACLVGSLVVGIELWSFLSGRFSRSIFSWKQRIQEAGLFVGHARDVARVLRESRHASEPPSPQRLAALDRYLDTTRSPASGEFFGLARGKNLVAVQVEAMQEWVIGARVHGHEITPFLNGLRARSFYFSDVWDQTAVSPTADCEYLAMNSLHPLPDGAVSFRFADNDFVALPGILAAAGYSTLSLHAFDRGFWNRAAIHPRLGFQHSFFDRELGNTPKWGWGLPDKVFFRRALAEVDRARAPFFAFLITLTSHHPYNYLPSSERRIDTTGLPEMLANYVASMHYVDEALAEFFVAFAARDYAKNTVVVIYGDHDSKIQLDEAAEAKSRAILSLDAQTLRDLAKRSFATRKIPFFVVLPGTHEPRTFERVGGQIDLAPTLLHLFGVTKPKAMIGRPLFGPGGAVFRFDGSAVEGERLWLPEGICRTLGAKSLAVGDCRGLAERGDEELQASWTITRHDLARRLSGALRASR